MTINKEKSETSFSEENFSTYKDKRKNYIINARFDNSESILETAKRLIRNEIANSYQNKPIKNDWRNY